MRPKVQNEYFVVQKTKMVQQWLGSCSIQRPRQFKTAFETVKIIEPAQKKKYHVRTVPLSKQTSDPGQHILTAG